MSPNLIYFGSDERRRKVDEFLPECINPTVKFGRGSAVRWGVFHVTGGGSLAKVRG